MLDSCINYVNPDLTIAKYTIIYSVAQVVYTLATIVLVFVAWRQLRNLNNSFNMSAMNAVISLEAEMNKRDQRVNEIALEIQKLNFSPPSPITTSLISFHNNQLTAAIESYLNALDRFCYCIVRDYLREDDWREEYRELIIQTVNTNPTFFGINTTYRNINTLFTRWS